MSSSLAPALHINGPVRPRYFCRVCRCCCCPSSTAASEQRRRSGWGSVSMQYFERCSYVPAKNSSSSVLSNCRFSDPTKKRSQFPNSPVGLGPVMKNLVPRNFVPPDEIFGPPGLNISALNMNIQCPLKHLC